MPWSLFFYIFFLIDSIPLYLYRYVPTIPFIKNIKLFLTTNLMISILVIVARR